MTTEYELYQINEGSKLIDGKMEKLTDRVTLCYRKPICEDPKGSEDYYTRWIFNIPTPRLADIDDPIAYGYLQNWEGDRHVTARMEAICPDALQLVVRRRTKAVDLYCIIAKLTDKQIEEIRSI